MKKSFKAFVKNAMVYALAASMLVSTPITASASGLNGVFSISDGTKITDPSGPTGTGTVTTTDTTTGVLKDNDANIIDIILDQDEVKMTLDEDKDETVKLTAKIIFDNEQNVSAEAKAALNKKIQWEITDGSASTVALSVKATDRTVCYLNPKKGGEVTVIATIVDTDNEKAPKYSASAKVIVKKYANGLELRYPTDTLPQFLKHTLDMNEYLYLDGVPKKDSDVNDEITWSIASSTKKLATISSTGIITFKKTGKVKVYAVSEKGYKGEAEINIEQGTKATKVEIQEKGADIGTTRNADMANETTISLTAVMTPENTTDHITWSSNKRDIVDIKEVKGDKDTEVVLELKKVGKAKITAKATNGKSDSVTINVTAKLTKLYFEGVPESLYTGQSLDLNEYVKREHPMNTDSLKWTVVDASGNKITNKSATVNGKGVLTVKPYLNNDFKTVTVKVESKKTSTATPGTVTIELKQSSIKGFTVAAPSDPVVRAYISDLKKGTAKTDTTLSGYKKQTVYVEKGKSYSSTSVDPADGYDVGVESLQWSSNKPKVAKVDRSGNITGVAAGSAKITVSGVYVIPDKNKAKTFKATFTVTVKQPTKSMTIKSKKALVVSWNPAKEKAKQNKWDTTFKATQNPKGAKGIVNWAANKNGSEYDDITDKGKLTLKKGTYDLGDEYTVVATAESGVTAKSTVEVVSQTDKVAIYDPNKNNDVFAENKPGKQNPTKNYVLLTLGDKDDNSITMQPMIKLKGSDTYEAAGTKDIANGKNIEGVTYTVNKSGIVQFIGNTVYAVGEGTVKITAKTPSGKKATLTVQVQ